MDEEVLEDGRCQVVIVDEKLIHNVDDSDTRPRE